MRSHFLTKRGLSHLPMSSLTHFSGWNGWFLLLSIKISVVSIIWFNQMLHKMNLSYYFNMVLMVQPFFDRLENIVGKGENAGNQHFLIFKMFQKVSFWGSLKVRIVWLRVHNDVIITCLVYCIKQISWNPFGKSIAHNTFFFHQSEVQYNLCSETTQGK